jgi:hypothetical protein
MAQRQLKQIGIQPPSSEELLALAATRVELPTAPFRLYYEILDISGQLKYANPS